MVAIVFPANSTPGRTPQEGAGVLVNAYAEQLGEGGAAAGVIRRVPGIRLWAESGQTGFRGMHRVGSTLYVAFNEKLVTIDAFGAVTVVPGDLAGTDPVYFASNNRTPTPQVQVVTNTGLFNVTPTSIDGSSEPDLPQPNSICFLDGFFFYSIADGRCYASQINSTNVEGLDYTSAEAKPDPLIRVVPFGRQLFLCGTSSIEIWQNTAEPEGFPFSRAAVMDRGLAGPRAITGYEDGFGKALMWVGDDDAIHVLNGYEPQRISTPDIDRQIAATAEKSQIVAGSYNVGSHPCCYFSGPGWTWVFDLSTQAWHQRKSYLGERWRVMGGLVKFAGRQIVGDTLSADLYEVTEDVANERGKHLVFEVVSGPTKQFPARLSVSRATFDFVVGVGSAPGVDPIETDPQVEVSWSDDGGSTWSNPLLRALGRQGEKQQRIEVRRTGLTGVAGRRWKLRISDPCYVGLLGGDMEVQAR